MRLCTEDGEGEIVQQCTMFAFTENLLATVLSVFSAIAAVILVIVFGKFDRVCDFQFVYSWSSQPLGHFS